MDYTALCAEVIELVNRVRTEPRAGVAVVEELIPRFDGKLCHSLTASHTWVTAEGVGAVADAASFLSSSPSVLPLVPSPLLHRLAAERAQQIAEMPLPSSQATTETLADRARSMLVWTGALGESVCLEESDAKEILRVMLIEDGNRQRTHRKNLLRKEFKHIGAAGCPHPTLQHVFVIVLADGVDPKPRPRMKFSEEDMPPDAISCNIKRTIKTAGGCRTVTTIKTYTMRDGSQQIVEEIEENPQT